MALFIIDFDHTLVDGHTHNRISRAILSQEVAFDDKKAQWDLVKDMPVLGGSDKWKAVFQSLFENGHKVAIASFNSYPHVISRFLHKIGLSDDQIALIYINSWLPSDLKNANKNAHIEQIIDHFYPPYPIYALYPHLNDRPRRNHVILTDDSDNNILAAEIADFRAIHAKPDLQFLDQLAALSCELSVDQSQASTPRFGR